MPGPTGLYGPGEEGGCFPSPLGYACTPALSTLQEVVWGGLIARGVLSGVPPPPAPAGSGGSGSAAHAGSRAEPCASAPCLGPAGWSCAAWLPSASASRPHTEGVHGSSAAADAAQALVPIPPRHFSEGDPPTPLARFNPLPARCKACAWGPDVLQGVGVALAGGRGGVTPEMSWGGLSCMADAAGCWQSQGGARPG